MTPLPSKQLTQMLAKRSRDYMFVDTATINYISDGSTQDAYGQPTQTTTSTEVSCSFTDKPKMEAWANYVDIELIDAEIRFIGTMPSKGDTVTLTHRFNRGDGDEQDFTAKTLEIIDIQDRDVFGYVCALKKVDL